MPRKVKRTEGTPVVCKAAVEAFSGPDEEEKIKIPITRKLINAIRPDPDRHAVLFTREGKNLFASIQHTPVRDRGMGKLRQRVTADKRTFAVSSRAWPEMTYCELFLQGTSEEGFRSIAHNEFLSERAAVEAEMYFINVLNTMNAKRSRLYPDVRFIEIGPSNDSMACDFVRVAFVVRDCTVEVRLERVPSTLPWDCRKLIMGDTDFTIYNEDLVPPDVAKDAPAATKHHRLYITSRNVGKTGSQTFETPQMAIRTVIGFAKLINTINKEAGVREDSIIQIY